jgi:ATP-dependent Clp protease ATP-binding subunit ClpA
MVAAGMAAGRGNALTLEHVLIGLVKSRGIARSALEALGCDLRGLSRALRSIAVRRKYGPSGPLSPEVQRVLAGAAERAAEAPSRRVSSFVLLLGVLGQAAGPLEELLVREGIDPARVEALLQRSEAAAWRDDPPG